MNREKLNLRPLQELLTSEVSLNELIEHLDRICYNFAECALKVSHLEKQHVYNNKLNYSLNTRLKISLKYRKRFIK